MQNNTLRCSIFDLEYGFNNFFANISGYPYRTCSIRSAYKGKQYSNIEVYLLTRFIKLPKLDEVKIKGYI